MINKRWTNLATTGILFGLVGYLAAAEWLPMLNRLGGVVVLLVLVRANWKEAR